METILMPQLKKDLKSAVLCAWLVEEGDRFTAGQPLCEVEADKVVCPIEAAFDGVLRRALCEEGDEIRVGAALAEAEKV